MEFPFEPRSTAHLRQGQFWCFELSNGQYVAGVVVARAISNGKANRRIFLAGLLDWHGKKPACPSELENSTVIGSGFAHIATIQNNGNSVIGELERHWEIPSEMEYFGLTADGPTLWGTAFIRALAEDRFGDKDWSDRQLELVRLNQSTNRLT